MKTGPTAQPPKHRRSTPDLLVLLSWAIMVLLLAGLLVATAVLEP